MVRIPAGSFMMGSNDGYDDEKPVHQVRVSAFEMDVTEVTVAQYRSCVSVGACDPPNSAGRCNFGQGGKDDHPVNCVDWDQATAFCAWAGKRLPTEAEWEYVARGTDGRTYPWGNEAPSEQLCWGRYPFPGTTCPVGAYPAGDSPFGVKDMAGNVWEWTSTEYCDSYAPRADCDSARVIRGGSWDIDDAQIVRAADRGMDAPAVRNDYHGFRCARP